MATKQQIDLSNYIKEIHNNLRRETKLFGAASAWENHCKNHDILDKYSRSMLELATNYWDKNISTDKISSRIMWSVNICEDYFLHKTFENQRKKEEDISKRSAIDMPIYNPDTLLDNEEKLKLLDVGSCYNPFEHFAIFDVMAIDIAPAVKQVFQCDFLNVSITNSFKYDNQRLLQMPDSYYNVIVFSLFLEYLPTPEQRHLSCSKAYELLKPEGLLIIITPDSKHVGANVKIMKTWRHILSRIGFNRIKYEKLQHIHCMAFRKCLNKDISNRWSLLHDKDEIFEKMHIPQDFNQIDLNKFENSNVKFDVVDVNLFKHLPDVIND